jgi:hypothetical protein
MLVLLHGGKSQALYSPKRHLLLSLLGYTSNILSVAGVTASEMIATGNSVIILLRLLIMLILNGFGLEKSICIPK